jgi:hypothetical protein
MLTDIRDAFVEVTLTGLLIAVVYGGGTYALKSLRDTGRNRKRPYDWAKDDPELF